MKTTKIDWCDCTINPVVGCSRGCVYCYARKMNTRFGWVEDFNKPQFFPERLKALNSKKPKSIFMNSVSDVSLWSKEQQNQCLNAMLDNPQHNYIFLSKDYHGFYPNFPHDRKNIFNGLTVATQDNLYKNQAACFDFLSIEPILEPIKIHDFVNVKQVIIGAETGNRKGKVIPPKHWIARIVNDCDRNGVHVFMKESLREIMGADFRQDSLIWEMGGQCVS